MEPEKLGSGSKTVGGNQRRICAVGAPRRPERLDCFDHRLECLKIAILEEWNELEAVEEDGALVIRIKESVKLEHLAEASDYKPVRKARKASEWQGRGLVGTH